MDTHEDQQLTKDEFADALYKGLGRAAFHLRQHGSAGMKELLLDACLSSLGCDPQFEHSRGEWLYYLLGLGDMRDMARPAILQAIREPRTETTDFWTVRQLLDLAAEFARNGDKDMRVAIYDMFDRQEFVEEWIGGRQIISLDGMVGLLHVARVLGKRVLCDPDYWLDEDCLWEANEILGENLVASTLGEHAKSNKNIRAFLDGIEENRKCRSSDTDRHRRSLSDVLTSVEHGKDKGLWLHRWGGKASPDELATILERIESEDRPKQLAVLLRVFGLREIPAVSAKVLGLPESPDEDVRWAAVRALSHVQSDQVREVALRLLTRRPPSADGIRMLVKSYHDGDHVSVESVLPTRGDADTIHDVVLDVTALTAEAKTPDLGGCLLWAYEYSPCSECRYYVVDHLVELGVAPKRVLRECLLDCSEETRETARSALGLPKERDWLVP